MPARSHVVAVTIACTIAVAGAHAAHAERIAVLPVDADRDGGKIPVDAAATMRAALVAQKQDVLDAGAVKRLILGQLSRGGTDIASYRAQIKQADQEVVTLDNVKALRTLEGVVNDLKNDPDFSTEKQQLLETTRLTLAARELSSAPAKETGLAETDAGKQAKALLVDAIRANPKLEVRPDEYQTKFLTLLAIARNEIAQAATGRLVVDSRPQGATVFLEGRDIGTTPLNLGKDVGLAAGRYRLWVEASGARSVPQFVVISEQPTSITIDLAFEGALWPDGPGLRPLTGASIDDEVAKKIGRFLGVDKLVLVGKAGDETSQWLWVAAFSVHEGSTVLRGSLNLNGDMSVEKAANKLAVFVDTGDASGVERKPLPPSVLPEKPAAIASSSTPSLSVSKTEVVDDGTPWLAIGIAAGAAVVVAAGVVTVAAIAAAPKNATYTITATSIDAGSQ